MTKDDDNAILLGYIIGKQFTEGPGTIPMVPFNADIARAVIYGDLIDKFTKESNNKKDDNSNNVEELRRLNAERNDQLRKKGLQNNNEHANNAWLEMNARASKGTFPWLTEDNETLHWSHYADGYGKYSGYATQLLTEHPDNSYVFDKKGKRKGHVCPNSWYIKENCGFPGNVPVLVSNGESVSETLIAIKTGDDKGSWKPISSIKKGEKIISWRKITPRGYVVSEVDEVIAFPKPSLVYDIFFENLPSNVTQGSILHVTPGQLLWTHHGWMDFGTMSKVITHGYENNDPTILAFLKLWGVPIRAVSPNPQLASMCNLIYNLVIKDTLKWDGVDTFCVPYGIARSYKPLGYVKKIRSLFSHI